MAAPVLPRRSSSSPTVRTTRRRGSLFALGRNKKSQQRGHSSLSPPRRRPVLKREGGTTLPEEPSSSLAFSTTSSSSQELSGPLRVASNWRRRRRSTTKGVQFNSKANVYHASDRRATDDDIKEMWYTEKDLRQFRMNSNFVAKTISKADGERIAEKSTWTNVLQNVYAACMEASCDHDLDNTVESTESTLTSTEESELMSLYVDDEARWDPDNVNTICGLERKAFPSIVQDKNQRRKHLVKTVRVLQEHATGHPAEDEFLSLEIRRHSEALSLTSRLYAQQLGHALQDGQNS